MWLAPALIFGSDYRRYGLIDKNNAGGNLTDIILSIFDIMYLRISDLFSSIKCFFVTRELIHST